MKKNDKRLKPIFYENIKTDMKKVNEIFVKYTKNGEFINLYTAKLK